MKLRKYLPVFILLTACAGITVHAASSENPGTTWNDHEYLVVEGDYTWDEAKELCEKQGGYLAVITTQEEQSFIQELIKGKNNEGFWLGAENSGDTWTWINGEEFVYQNWDSGEPNGDSNDMKLQIYEENGKWDDTWSDGDTNGIKEHGFICEKDTSQNGNGDQGKESVSGESDTQKETSSEQTDEKDNTVELADLHTSDSDSYEILEEGITDSYGEQYEDNIVRFNAAYTDKGGYAVYDLNGQYGKFHGKILTSEETHSDALINLAIFADGKQIYAKTEISRQSAGEDFQVDLTGVGKLEIKTSNDGWAADAFVYIVDGTVEKLEDRVVYPEYSSLNDMFLIDSGGFSNTNTLMRDSYGNLHNGYQGFDTWQGGYAVYNLDQKYLTFEGAVVTGTSDDPDGAMQIQIYLDNQLAFSQANITKQTGKIPVSLDVTDVKVMKVVTQTEDSFQWLYLVDDILMPHTHTPGEWEIKQEPTCTVEGIKVQYCTECKEECNKGEIEALGHKPGDWEVKEEPTCTKEGTEVQICTVCKEECNTREIEALGHEPGEWEIKQEATCAEEGIRVKYCTRCKEECETEKIDVLEHTPGDQWETETEATCSEAGEEVKRCTVCGEICEKRSIPQKDHEESDEWETTIEATCSGEGEEVLRCKNCGLILDHRTIEKQDHEPGDAVETVAPTCTSSGTSVVYCKNCGEILETTPVPEKGHTFGEWVTVRGSIWNSPLVKERICSVCGFRDSEKSYAWIWVKPVVIIVILGAVIIWILYTQMVKAGLEPKKENIKKLFEKKKTDLMERLEQSDNDDETKK